ncbi:MAG: RecX family transcriptional regulator, partial [Alphaproteobacteria bacterium]|nr:RecX family transcriptional regulator [Alphaproteobacteria bacterium]
NSGKNSGKNSGGGRHEFSARGTRSPRRQKPIRIPDLAYLERVAIWYLERYAASSAMLRRVLMRRVERAARAQLIERELGQSLVDQIITKCQALGYIHDQDFAGNLAGRLARRGASQRQIEAALRARGLGADDIAEAVTHAAREAEAKGENPEFAAAQALARRRHLGPYRTAPFSDDPSERAKQRTRDFSVLARAGHSSAIARQVLDHIPDD